MGKHPAVFLDRDGTIIEDRGYIKNTSDINVFHYSFEALELLQENYLLFIISNQSGVGKGIISVDDVSRVNHHLIELLKSRGIAIYDIFICPHTTEDNCACKKPGTYFIQEAEKKYNLNLSKSFIIGDHPSDVECGINSGVSPIYLLSGHGEKHRDELTLEVPVYTDLLDAAKSIVAEK